MLMIITKDDMIQSIIKQGSHQISIFTNYLTLQTLRTDLIMHNL